MEIPNPNALLNEADAARMAGLVHPFTLPDFLAAKWPDGFMHSGGPASRLAGLLDLPELADIGSLLRSPIQGTIRADYTRVNRASEMDITPELGLELYRSACTIYVTRLASEQMLRWTQTLDRALGLIPGTAQVNAFASLPGPGLSWHWDPQEIFIVQVRGRKVWHVAPNQDLAWPTKSGQAGAERRPEIRYQLNDRNKPVEAPSTWETIEMVPGSVMFMPRGYWHTTENIDESLHLVLQVKLLSWRDVFSFLFENVPALYSPEWRKPTMALHPERLFDTGLAEFRARCDALSAFASPQGIKGLAQMFERSRDAGGRS